MHTQSLDSDPGRETDREIAPLMPRADATMAPMTERQELIELAAIVDAAATDFDWEHQIVAAVIGEHPEQEIRQRLAEAFRLHAQDFTKNDERFGPMFTFEGGATVPAPLAEIADETCAVWGEVVEHASHPRVRARLHDLLFERRWANVGSHGAAAATAYLEDAAEISPPSQRTVDSLRRAHQLARLTRNGDLAEVVTAELLRAAAASIEDLDPKPGVALRLIDVLVDTRCPDPALDELLAVSAGSHPQMRATAKPRGVQPTGAACGHRSARAPDRVARRRLAG